MRTPLAFVVLALAAVSISEPPVAGWTDGVAHSIKGKRSVVVLFATWCGGCEREVAKVDKLAAEHPTMPFFGLTAENLTVASAVAKRFPHLVIGYGPATKPSKNPMKRWMDSLPADFPETVVLDSAGNPAWMHSGELDDADLRAIESKIR